jgi:ribulose 1,5-bisphosphate carboxylase large subunit-like protein
MVAQKTCPIVGGAINKKLYVDYKGKRIYACCQGCVDAIKKDPDAAIKKLNKLGEKPEKIKKDK